MPQNSSSHKNFPPRICIKFREGINISYGDQDELHDYISKNKILPLKKLQEQYKGIEIGKYFTSVEPQRIRELLKEAKENHYTGRRNKKSDRPLREYEPPRLFSYCAMDCPYGTDVTALQRSLLKYPDVEIAYVEGGPCPPPAVNAANDPRAGNQHHLDPSPIGIDARFAWTQTGGNGASTVKFVDIENGWTLNHEDLPRSGINLLSGVNHSSKGHGTSVLGVVLAKDNTIGGIGITPSVKANVISAFRTAIVYNIADAILSA